MKALIQKTYNLLGYQVKPLPRGKPSPIHLWEEDAAFNRLYEQVRGRTVVSKQRCFMLYQFANQVQGLSGDVAEVGVYRGGTARLLARVFDPTGKPLHLFDTFTGLPDPDPGKDTLKAGDFGDTSLESVRAYLQDCPNLCFYPGFFPATAGPVQERSFCFAHIDVDIYQSVMDCCAFYYPRLVTGGILIFDDYGDLSCPGARQAVEEFFSDKPEQPCYLPTGQCLVVRLP